MKKLISLLLVLALVAAWLPVQTLAVLVEHTDHSSVPLRIETDTGVQYNPLYPIPEEDVPFTRPDSNLRLYGEEDVTYAESFEAAVALVRQAMVERQTQFTIHVKLTVDEVLTMGSVPTAIFNEALVHTGNPKEGDSLMWVYKKWESTGQYYIDGDYAMITQDYALVYYTDAAQEAELDLAVEQLLNSFSFAEDASDYTKIKTVYDYVCANITYDYDHLNDESYTLKYSAYAALIQRTAVCQGYASLMYRLLLELGVDCRLISSIRAERHAWNIVKLGDYYYNFDSTWDAECYPNYEWFLLSQADFERHTRNDMYATEEFHAQYPMDPVSYNPGNSHTHVFETTVVEPTCASQGYTVHTCTICGESYADTYVDPISHQYAMEVTPPTCIDYGYTTYTCIVCGDSYTADYTPTTDHIYGEGVVTPPTCTDEGYTTYTCTVCGDQILDDFVAPSDHTPDETGVCTVCGEKTYLFDVGLKLDMLILGEDGVYRTPYGDRVLIAVSAPLAYLNGYSLADYVMAYGSDYFSMTHWDALLSAADADGCVPLTPETLVWILDVITGNPNWEEDETYLTKYLGFAVDHIHAYETERIDATCTEMGVVVNTCVECGIYEENYSYPNGHTLDENYVCLVCGEKMEYVVDCDLTMEDLYLGADGIYYTADGKMAVIAVTAPLYFWLSSYSLEDFVVIYGEDYFSLTYWDQLLAAANEAGYAPLTPETLAWMLDVITGNPNWGEDASYLTYYLGFKVDCEHSYVDGVCVHCGAQEESKVLSGDVNGDGQINTRDAKLIMQYELGLIDETNVDLAAADVNGDGQINTRDAKLIMQLELGLITEFPR